MGGMLDAALELAQRGFAIVPCHSMRDGGCSCGAADCRSKAKHPRTEHGLDDASKEPERIRSWWQRWPDANVAICTGAVSGVWVLDEDPRHGGDVTLSELERNHGRLHTHVALTGGGGHHFFFVYPRGYPGGSPRWKKQVGRGLDIKGDGGYVIAAPSMHESGRAYQWLDITIPIVPAPDWLLALAIKEERPSHLQVVSSSYSSIDSPYAMSAVASELAKVRNAREGQRNDTLNRAAFSLGQLVGGNLLDGATTANNLLNAALVAGLGEHESEKTIRSGMAAGIDKPRGIPSGNGTNSKPPSQADCDAPDAEKEPTPTNSDASAPLIAALIDEILREGALPKISTGLPSLDRALDGGFRVRTVAVLVGGPGAGKSSLSLQIGAHHAESGGSVLLYSGEQTRGHLAARAVGQRLHRRWGEVMDGAVSLDEMHAALDHLRLYVLSRCSNPITAIVHEADTILARDGGTLLVVVDYAQLVADLAAKDIRTGMIIAADSLLKLAEERDVAVLVNSQGSRANARRMREGDGEAVDFMDVSAETSAWERNASTVIALTGGTEKGVGGSRLVTAMLAKGRMTGDARVGLRFYGATGVWEDMGEALRPTAERQAELEDEAVLATIGRHPDGIALRAIHGLVILGPKVLAKGRVEAAAARLLASGRILRRPIVRPFNGGMRTFDLLFVAEGKT